jgi:hypothetical protein
MHHEFVFIFRYVKRVMHNVNNAIAFIILIFKYKY